MPVGTFITNALSWRAAFAIVALAGATTYILARMWLPHMPALPDHGFRNQFHFLRTLPPWLIFGGVIFAQTGLYCWYSYIDPQLTTIARFSTADLSWLMVVAGAGMFIGNLASGRLCDRFKPSAVATGVMVGGVVVLLLIFFFFDIKWLAVALLLCGTGALFASGSPLQSSIVGYSKGGELLGGACIQIAYNGGNAIAAQIGAAVIDTGLGYRYVSLAGVPLVILGATVIYILYFRYERRH